jgi:CRP/FNR family transcriptional regulator
MHIQTVRPMVVADPRTAGRCAACDARHHSICSALDDDELVRLAGAAVGRDIENGQIFIEEGDKSNAFYNVTQGTAKLFKQLPDGRQQITSFAGVGHFLGLAVTDTYAFSAEAIEPMRVCRFSRRELCGLLHDLPALERRLLQTACNELVAAQEQMLLLGRKTARERLASFLIAQSNHAGPCGRGAMHLHLPMTRTEIADYLGLTVETVSRTFSQFKADKRIALPSRTEVMLLDRDWLEEVATGMAE